MHGRTQTHRPRVRRATAAKATSVRGTSEVRTIGVRICDEKVELESRSGRIVNQRTGRTRWKILLSAPPRRVVNRRHVPRTPDPRRRANRLSGGVICEQQPAIVARAPVARWWLMVALRANTRFSTSPHVHVRRTKHADEARARQLYTLRKHQPWRLEASFVQSVPAQRKCGNVRAT